MCPAIQFPLACPSCDHAGGVPVTATTRREGGVEVSVRCRDCAHEWQCTLPAESLDLHPKPDRRSIVGEEARRKK